MTFSALSRCVALLACAALPFTAHAQITCGGTLTYSPPSLDTPIALTFTSQSSAPPTSTQSTAYTLQVEVVEPGAPAITTNGSGGRLSITNTPYSLPFSFTPFEPGQITVHATTTAIDSPGQTPLCGEVGPSATILINYGLLTAPPAHDAFLGQFAFSFNGFNAKIQGISTQIAAIGSFTADGNGHITAGTEDVNSGAGSSTLIPITGSYTIDPLGNGLMKIESSFGVQQLSFFLPSLQSFNATNVPIFSTDGSVVFGTGLMQRQSVSGVYSIPYLGSYAVSLAGYLPCTATCDGGAPVYESGSLSFDAAPGGPHGTLSGSVGAVLLPNSPVGDTQFADVDPTTGRFTFTLSQGQLPPLHFVSYTIDGLHLLLLSTDSHQITYLLSGTAIQQ